MRVADAECINAKSAKLRLVAAMAELEPGALIGKRMSPSSGALPQTHTVAFSPKKLNCEGVRQINLSRDTQQEFANS